MDRNTIIGFVLIFGLIVGFGFYNTNQNKKVQEQRKKEALENFAQQKSEDIDILTALDSLSNTEKKDAVAAKKEPAKIRKPFSDIEPADKSDYVVETEKAKYHISSKGGHITQIELKDIYKYSANDSLKEPLILFEGGLSEMNLEMMLRDQTMIQSKDYYFTSNTEKQVILYDETSTFSLKMHPSQLLPNENDSLVETIDPNSYLEYLYTFNNNDYKIGFKINFVNMAKYLYPTTKNFVFDWSAVLNNTEKNYEYERDITSLFYMDNLDEVDNIGEKSAEKKNFSTPIKWIAFKQQFFTSVLIADDSYFDGGDLKVNSFGKNESHHLKEMMAKLDFEINDLDKGEFGMSAYFGPNQYKLLKQYDLDLEQMVPLGGSIFRWINKFAVIPVFNWLETYGLSYGLIILILTIMLKIILLPIAFKTYMSSARMRVLKPELEEIANRYPKPDDMAKKQQATMTLYKSAGINPASGCLPMLLQFPILVAMFRFFPSAYELRQQPFLWAEDLSTYDSILDFGFTVPFYGDHISLFTLLMTVATLVYTWLNNKLMGQTGNDQSQKMMKMMMYIMPIMFLGIFNKMPAALTYYYLLVNLITFLQMWIFRMAVNEDKLHAKLKQNMKKPIKKSKWQLKMEEVAKQQAQMQKRK